MGKSEFQEEAEYIDDLIWRLNESTPISEEVLIEKCALSLPEWLEWCEEHPESQTSFIMLEAVQALERYAEILAVRTGLEPELSGARKVE